jgi:HAMP domain-containing protein
MRTSTKLLILLLLLSVSLSKVDVSFSQPQPFNNAQTEIQTAYKALIEAYNAGGNINELIDQLNEALNLTAQAESARYTEPNQAQTLTSEAQALAQNVTQEAPTVKDQGLQKEQIMMITLGASVTALLIVGIVIYVSGPKALWKMWLKLRKNYRIKVKKPSTQNKGLIITSQEVCAIILGATIIIAFFAVSQVYLAGRVTEPFSELGILGPTMKLGNYPTEIVAGQTVNLYAYVGNQMGRPIYYIVMVKLGDNATSVNPAPIEPALQFEKILSNNETWVFPVNVTLTQPGLNQRIIFELWTYNETLNQNQYSQVWDQVWLNVTAPAT